MSRHQKTGIFRIMAATLVGIWQLLPFHSLAQNPVFYENGLRITHFTNEDALRWPNMHNVTKDNQGQIWIADGHVLHKYNGYDFEILNFGSTGVNIGAAWDVKQDLLGSHWFATWFGFIVKLNDYDHSWSLEKIKDQEGHDEVITNLTIDPEDHIYYGNRKGILDITDRDSLDYRHIDLPSFADSLSDYLGEIGFTFDTLAAFLQCGNDYDNEMSFDVKEPTKVLVIGMGELDSDVDMRNFGSYTDYGWLEDARGQEIYRMHPENSLNAGPILKNRMNISILDLDTGTYALHFRSDQKYSAEDDFNWPVWGFPYHANGSYNIPSKKEWWGMQVLKLDAQIADLLAKEIDRYGQYSGLKSDFPYLFRDLEGRIWVYNQCLQELVRDPQGRIEFKDHLVSSAGQNTLPFRFINEIEDLDSNRLWISAIKGNKQKPEAIIGYYDKSTAKFQEIKTGFQKSTYLTLEYDHNGSLWVGNYGQEFRGLYQIQPPFVSIEEDAEPHVRHFSLQYREAGENARNYTYGLELDDFNNLWVATERNYLFKIELGEPPYVIVDDLRKFPNMEGALKLAEVIDEKNNLWFHVQDPSRYWTVARYNLDTKKLQTYHDNFYGIPFRYLKFIAELANGHLLFQNGKDIIDFDPQTEKAVVKLTNVPGIGRRDGRILAMGEFLRLNDSLVYVDQNIIVNVNNWKVFADLKKDLSLPKDVFQAGRAHNGDYWLDLQDIGRMRFDITPQGLTRIDDPDKLTIPHGVMKGPDSLYYYFQYGLVEVNGTSGTEKSYTYQDGISTEGDGWISFDQQGKMWIFHSWGISIFDPEKGTLRRPSQYQNIKKGPGNILETKDDIVYFLSYDGDLFRLDRKTLHHDSIAPILSLTSMNILKKEDPTTAMINPKMSMGISLPFSQNSISISYEGLQFRNPTDVVYAYRLLGLDESWQEVSEERAARFINLPPGDYTFEVKAANADHVWSPVEQTSFTILPPWWLTWWAKALYFVLSVSLVVGFILWRTGIQRRKLKQVTELNYRLQQIDKLKDQFLANTSHELRTPLNGIIGIAESMVEGATGPLSTKSIWNLNLITSSGKRLSSLINDILDFSKMRSRELVLKKTPVDVHSAADVVLKLAKPLTAKKDIKLVNEVPEDMQLAEADENRLQQILHNLVGNAIKFTDSGKVEVKAARQNGHIRVDVVDTGVGIEKENFEKIFHAFEQTDGSTARSYGGTGLGLSVTKQLVELHGGTIDVHSDLGQGSTFTFTLPTSKVDRKDFNPRIEESKVAFVEDIILDHKTNQGTDRFRPGNDLPIQTETLHLDPNLPPRGERKMHPGDPKKHRILTVDDEPINLQVLENQLSQYNYDIVQATNGRKALEILAHDQNFDLILLDVMMPKMSGYEVCEQIRNRFPSSQLPIIMLTAKNRVTDLVEGFTSGANDYLTKPFSKDELITRIRTHLELAKVNKAYGRFVPHRFIDMLGKESIIDVNLGDQTQGEMTLLFSDIRSYTTLSERMSPEENFRFINRYLQKMGPVIHEHNGFINQYLGDGIMALFTQSPEDALSASISMQKEVRIFNSELIKEGASDPIQMGIGLHTGNLMLGILGDNQRNDTGIISDAVNTASRMEGLTKIFGTSILLSGNTLEKINQPEHYATRFLGKVQVKGRERTVMLYECFNGDNEQSFHLKNDTLETFKEALSNYYERDFLTATGLFKKIVEKHPQDRAARMYLELAAQYIVNGVPDYWNGVIKMQDK